MGHPPPLVQWRKLNGSLSDRASIINMSMSTNEGNLTRVTVDLLLTRIHREDTGIYVCSSMNILNTVTRSIDLIVQCMYIPHMSLLCVAMWHAHMNINNQGLYAIGLSCSNGFPTR